MTGPHPFTSTDVDTRQVSLTPDDPCDFAAVLEKLRDLLAQDDDLARLRHLHELAQLVDEERDRAVAGARQSGATWQAIGAAVDISRQAAQARWSPTPRPRPKPEARLRPVGAASPDGLTAERVTLRVRGVPVTVAVDVTRRRITT